MLNTENDTVEFDKKKLVETVKLAVRFLDDVITINHYPLKEIEEQTLKSRKVGLGIMGFADVLLKMGIPYNSKEGRDLAEEIMGTINVVGHEYSKELAEEKGAFPIFEESTLETPIRNATITTLAPTGSISMIAGTSGGVEPIFAYAFTRNIMDGEHLIEVNPILEEKLREVGLDTDEIKQRIAEEGSIQNITEIPESIRRVFVCAQDISPEAHVEMQAAFQRHTDNAVSKTVNFASNATKEDIANVYILAYKLGCKGVTVYRDGSRDSQVLTIGNKKEEQKNVVRPREPKEYMYGISNKETVGCGSLHITVTHDDEGIAEVYTSTGSTGGCPAQSEAVARLTSLLLRAGVDFEEICAQLHKPNCVSCARMRAKNPNGIDVKSCPDAIAKALKREYERLQKEKPQEPKVEIKETKKDIPSNSSEIKKCPECGAKVSHEGGCVICPECGWSKCG